MFPTQNTLLVNKITIRARTPEARLLALHTGRRNRVWTNGLSEDYLSSTAARQKSISRNASKSLEGLTRFVQGYSPRLNVLTDAYSSTGLEQEIKAMRWDPKKKSYVGNFGHAIAGCQMGRDSGTSCQVDRSYPNVVLCLDKAHSASGKAVMLIIGPTVNEQTGDLSLTPLQAWHVLFNFQPTLDLTAYQDLQLSISLSAEHVCELFRMIGCGHLVNPGISAPAERNTIRYAVMTRLANVCNTYGCTLVTN